MWQNADIARVNWRIKQVGYRFFNVPYHVARKDLRHFDGFVVKIQAVLNFCRLDPGVASDRAVVCAPRLGDKLASRRAQG